MMIGTTILFNKYEEFAFVELNLIADTATHATFFF